MQATSDDATITPSSSIDADEESPPQGHVDDTNHENENDSSVATLEVDGDEETATSTLPWSEFCLHEFGFALALIGGTVATYVGHSQTAGSAVAVSGLFGLVSGFGLPFAFAAAAFCGSFAGMAGPAVIPNLSNAVGMGAVLVVIVRGIMDRWQIAVGLGGRLGFMAQLACSCYYGIFQLWLKMETSQSAWVRSSEYDTITLRSSVEVVGLTLAGAAAMHGWRLAIQFVASKSDTSVQHPVWQRTGGTVVASSVVGVVAGFVLPNRLAGPLYCGSFVPMATPAKVPPRGLWLASLLAGFCQLALQGVFVGGWGGKLGTSAFGGVLGYRLVVAAMKRLFCSCWRQDGHQQPKPREAKDKEEASESSHSSSSEV